MAIGYLGKNLRFHLADNIPEVDLRVLLYEISSCARYINMVIKDANRGLAGGSNAYGEQQMALDVMADTIMQDRFRRSMVVSEFASEENEDIVGFSHTRGNYSVTVDPLDGSSLIDVNLTIGSIVGVHESKRIVEPNSIVAAMFVLYGPLTTLVYAVKGLGVHEFVLNPAGEFTLARERMTVKQKGSIMAPGGLERDWTPGHAAYITELRKRGYKLRYSGGMVPDINQILVKGGGVFCYPAMKNAPNGKLRLLFENQPMAFIMEEAGGMASTGTGPILDVKPEGITHATPLYIGSKDEVLLAEEILAKHAGHA
ncbi:MAG: class 1 fructose-bisphosphatase [Planctomycetota bacterium]